MLTKIGFGALAPLFIVAASAAQSFNIDIDSIPSPPSTYGGLAGPVGTWNTVPIQVTPTPLTTVTGTPDNSNAWFNPLAIPASQSFTHAPHIELYTDFAGVGPDPAQFHVDNLAAGSYAAVLYSWFPGAITHFTLTASGSAPQQATVTCPSGFPGLAVGQSLAQFAFSIPPGGGSVTIEFVADPDGNEGGVLNGVQLATSVGTQGCPQPINSVMAFPTIVATGTLDPTQTGFVAAANDIQLSVGLLPASNTAGIGAILCFVANDNSVIYPQTCPAVGQRCIGNPQVVRVWDPNAAPGSGGVGKTTAAGTYNLPIDLPSLAALGVNVSPGATLHFQMIYRDNNNTPPVFCPTDPSLKRWTESLSIQLF